MATNDDLVRQLTTFWEPWTKLWAVWSKGFSQTINLPSGDVPMDFLNWKPTIDVDYYGDPGVERRIYREHAGVGSQLGTIIDAVAELAKTAPKDNKGKPPAVIEKLLRLQADVDAEKTKTVQERLEKMISFLKDNKALADTSQATKALEELLEMAKHTPRAAASSEN